jgi:hypothetical protein
VVIAIFQFLEAKLAPRPDRKRAHRDLALSQDPMFRCGWNFVYAPFRGSVLVGPLGSCLWRGTEQERSATALSAISVLGICFSVAVFPFLRKITRKLRVFNT